MDPSSFHPPSLPDHDATVARDWVLLRHEGVHIRPQERDDRHGLRQQRPRRRGVLLVRRPAGPLPLHRPLPRRRRAAGPRRAVTPRVLGRVRTSPSSASTSPSTPDPGAARDHDHFVYTAIPDRPSLVRLPNPHAFPTAFDAGSVGLLRMADGEGFVVVALSPKLWTLDGYNLRIFSSKLWGWIFKPVQLQVESTRPSTWTRSSPSRKKKVRWAGLISRGCVDHEQPSPALRCIPLPGPMAGPPT
ncbi:hypothetical protein ZWY2020_018186 [Hordeum vulgare]|nr:hypothetical protein ZWY2020_018186 [Hordeum vulgare]